MRIARAATLVLIAVFALAAMVQLQRTSAVIGTTTATDHPLNAAVADRTPQATVAVCVLLTHSTRTPNLPPTIDGMGVLRKSIKRLNMPEAMDFIVLATPSVPKKWFPVVEALGWTVKPVAHPIEADEVRNKQIADEVTRDGAMGIAEMVKLVVLTWTQYDTIIFTDADVMFHKPFPELLRLNVSLGWTEGGWPSERINGGFLVFKPKLDGPKHFNAMIEILREGDFRSGTGWKGSGIGWTYGGRTIQGILPYYYFKVLNGQHQYIERCRYNNMVQLDKCKAKEFEEVTSNHFTGDCIKPWWCNRGRHKLCRKFQQEWWGVAETLWAEFGGSVEGLCTTGRGHYKSLAEGLLEKRTS